MASQLRDLFVPTQSAEQGRDLTAKISARSRFFIGGIPQDVPYFLLHASTTPTGAPLQLTFYLIFEVANHQLCHMPTFPENDIMISDCVSNGFSALSVIFSFQVPVKGEAL
jgi:hypothetical protein